MQFRRIHASFGKLKGCQAEFVPGLNIIHSPNESGKSTLASFLRVMLYGLSTRERGAAADKNRYAPWHGGAMEGRLELTHEGSDITLTRDTARANSPMGRFRAVYTGTDEPYPDLDGANCGETLTGVPREVYERSAFIRQSGIAVDQDAELEKRIAALITTGEESASFSEVVAALKKQLNARKHNKTGAIPRLEAELEGEQATLVRTRSLTAEKNASEAQLDELGAKLETLKEELTLHDRADKYEKALALSQARRESEKAESEAILFETMLKADRTPARETLLDARSQLRLLNDAEEQLEEAKLALQDAEQRPVPQVKMPIFQYVLFAAYFALIAVLLLPYGSEQLKMAAAACTAVVTSVLVFFGYRLKRQRFVARSGHDAAVQEAKAAVTVSAAAHESVGAKLCGLLSIADAAQAGNIIESAMAKLDKLDALQKAAQEALLRCELLAHGTDESAERCERPVQSREELAREAAELDAQMRELQRRIDRIDGALRDCGGMDELEASIGEKEHRLTELQAEYEAIALAMDALERANGELQSRFSPELGKRAAEYFAALTGGKYESVLLDRSFGASAAEVGSPVARESGSLSQGAADQLYFAVRLAICDLLLGENVPLVLDDALTNFDDTRCAAALELLAEKGKRQQILLFTCQSREAQLLAGRADVHVQTLTADPSCI